MCLSRSDLRTRLAASLSRFAREARGAGTVFSLSLLLVAAMFGGLVVDVGNAWRYRELLKTTADVAAHAGAVVLAQGGTAEQAREAALQAVELNMPHARYGPVLALPSQDVRPVHYDPATNRISPEGAGEDEEANAILVVVQRSAASHNPVPTMLLRLVGNKAWDIASQSVVALVPTQTCQAVNGIYAQGVLLPGPGTHVGKAYCLHAQDKVIPGDGSLFETGSHLSMPDLAGCGLNCTDVQAQGVEAARFEVNLIRPALVPLVQDFRSQLTAPLRQLSQVRAPARDAYFAHRALPQDLSALDEVGVPIDKLQTGAVIDMTPAAFTRLREVPQGLVYRVMCSAAAGKALPGASIPVPMAPEQDGAGLARILTLSGTDVDGNMLPRVYRNMVLISDCQIRIDATARIEGAVILSARGKEQGAGYDIITATGARIGDPDGRCDADHRSTILALGSVLMPAGALGTNVGVVAGGDIRIAPPDGPGGMIYGATGIGLHAAGAITLDVPHDLAACGYGKDAAPDPFAPALMVLRQVAPTDPSALAG